MNGEPRWRILLNWSAVITFFTVPLISFLLHLMAIVNPGWFNLTGHTPGEFKYMQELERNVTILVFGLAGLHSWEQTRSETKDEKTGTSKK
jgi:hypothetical protein